MGRDLSQATVHPAIEDPWEHMIYWAHVRAAEAGELVKLKADLAATLDCSESTLTTIEQRMELKGWIKVDRYQRGRRVTIMSTGKKTAQPLSTAPHWRGRPEHTDGAFSLMRMRHPDMAQAMLCEARRQRKSPATFMVELMLEALKARSIQTERVEG